ncbi:molecular chaperone Hsp33 [Marchantia polymorpha subsp. ruderalis]|uniref:Uncharacterized protein n=2 Tax=Marchantia polymorpha TaxID=3197 RepID=A0AAF6BF65_MARPO|nr:hypothetical protein MARPO_0027s0096 [Marchantia polymorpha]BBN10647.1 hypothetical protein Mp_5g05300 [Marchantia polymorpha subsp. ruderalis]PTQ42986.1 hypothetical protein MARPO_0027s0096 [Marchantia polymorpha]PTQ42987.1 hypothetical protein MARPO_0027s0096 [Marchantia polymorpha]BBN10648.1 hypothetical protein Mp_5g05300 [Marchantia polymorpha subsp. ruderalis]|eukprot:PTQ42985.1 hypothetical protein MARPO_0027s0096 [Marchantia polymorpha]
MAMASSALSLTWKWRRPAPDFVQNGQKFLQRHSSNFKSGAQSKNQRPGFGSDFLRVTVRHSIRPSANTRLPQRLRVFTTVAQGENGAKNGVGVSKGDQLLRCISYDAEVSILTLVATDVVREAQRRHQTSPTASAALGRALMGTLLVGAMKGNDESVQVTFLGQGPLGQMTTVYRDNMVKGFVVNPDCETALKSDGKLDVGSAVGTGILTVVRNNANWAQPYSGTVPIYSGEVAEDIAHYLADSEQINVALGVGVSLSKSTAVQFAGGFLVQVLPFCSDETLAKLEENILKMPPLSDSSDVMTAKKISELLLEGIGIGDYDDLPEPKFGPCTVEELKPRMVRAVASLGKQDVEEILAEQGHVEVKCEFCAEVVRFGEADLQHILQPSSQ